MSFNIAIDGPSGAGKSTIARLAAKKLNYIYIDTGAMYRAMALYLIRNKIDMKDRERIADSCDKIDISITYRNGEQQVLLNGENITSVIRAEEIGKAASVVSAYECVRNKLVDLQRALAQKENVIMDGRDIGTCVLPQAQLKIYLTAGIETRGKRRHEELVKKGTDLSLAEVCQDMKERDERDRNRAISPLRQAADAILVDSTFLTIDEVVDTILSHAKEKFT